jgi:hypothetical protein
MMGIGAFSGGLVNFMDAAAGLSALTHCLLVW